MINTILIVVSIIAGCLILFSMYQKAKLQSVEIIEEDFTTIDKVVEAVKLEMVEIIKEDYSLGLSDKEFNALYKRKARIQDALKNCVYGIDSAKVIVIELIRSFIADNIKIEKINDLLGLSEGQDPSDHTKFEIIMYSYKKQFGKDALAKWVDKNNFARERNIENSTKDFCYYISIDDLHRSYDEEDIHLSDDEKIDILSILVYQLYKGFGIVDTLREMNINGFNMGTSGSILSNINKQKEGIMKANNAVWLYYRGKYIHLRFMNYGTEEELKRIVQLLVRYNNPGPLTAKRGYLVNTMYDKSRILALRPPASEYWAIFVRKFSLSDLSPEALIWKKKNEDGTTEIIANKGDLPIKLIEYLMRGHITCAVTGRQGSGKTTLMSSIIRYIDPRYTIRVLEMAPELYLRELYPTRNILSVQETTTVTAAELQDALKKSDAAVSIVGEVATDVIAARMIQMGMTASIFTIFSHHANTARDLVFTLRNSLVNAGGFSNMDTAERQVLEVVKMDIHLDYTPEGKRYIDRISEIIPLEEKIPYPELESTDINGSLAKITKEYYERQTDRVSFWTQDILRFDLETNTYYVANRISPALESKIRFNMDKVTRKEFDKFIFTNWGRRKDNNFTEKDEIAEAMLEYAREDDANCKVMEYIDDIDENGEMTTIPVCTLEIVDEGVVTSEDIEDVELFFNFFDGEVNV